MTELVVEFSASAYLTDTHLSRLTRIPNTQDTVLDILDTAHARHCGTVVVGRESYHGLKALLTSHVSDELISQGEGLAVWVVE